MYIVLIVIMFLFSPGPLKAQEITSDSLYQEYLSSQEKYSKEHSEYLLARSQYRQAGTLAAETKARGETSQMLAARDEVFRTYLEALRSRLLGTQSISENTKNGLSSRLESDMQWYANHRDRVSSAGTINDLVNDSKEASDHYNETTVPIVYETLIVVPMARVSELRRQLSVIVSDLRGVVNTVADDGVHDVSNTDRWFIQIDGKINRSIDKELEAQAQLQALQNPERKTNYASAYGSSMTYITESHQFLKEASSFADEVIRLIRTKN